MKLKEAQSINPNAILIHSGVLFDVFNPNPDDIKIFVIAHALSNLCRYGGHSPDFYSVAQHSYFCSYWPGTPKEKMERLMHDASEAFLIDMPRPIKKNLPEYIIIEEKLLKIIFNHFNLTYPLTKIVHEIDNAALEFEYKRFFENKKSVNLFTKIYRFFNNTYEKDPWNSEYIEFWSPKKAKSKFIKRYNELKAQIEAEK